MMMLEPITLEVMSLKPSLVDPSDTHPHPQALHTLIPWTNSSTAP